MIKVAALFVEVGGTYSELDWVDTWFFERDARTYPGPHPVVAHPPCNLWGKFARVNYARWGGEHNRPGNDGGCFDAALYFVRKYGGVLEHPAQTYAFAEYGLPQPICMGWQSTLCGGWVCEVWQSAYGHRANKATWLYYYGDKPPASMRWSKPRGTHQIGEADQRGKAMNKPSLRGKAASATPTEFRDALLDLALNSV
jgi:hypothetical protein